MAPRYDEAPEVAPHYLPEVHHPPTQPEVAQYGGTPMTPIQKPEGSHSAYTPGDTNPSVYGQDHHSAYGPGSQYGTEPERRPKKTICGCAPLIFVLSAIIALLSAAVIGLAAGTGVEANRASDFESQVNALKASKSATVTVTSSAPSATSTAAFDAIDNHCSTNSSGVTGSTYTSSFFEKSTYTIFCNNDTPHAQLLSLFVGNLNDCMDACTHFTHYEQTLWGDNANTTCEGISFIPLWTDRTSAVSGGAPGNCYLKPGPQNRTALTTPNIGTECHAAILAGSD